MSVKLAYSLYRGLTSSSSGQRSSIARATSFALPSSPQVFSSSSTLFWTSLCCFPHKQTRLNALKQFKDIPDKCCCQKICPKLNIFRSIGKLDLKSAKYLETLRASYKSLFKIEIFCFLNALSQSIRIDKKILIGKSVLHRACIYNTFTIEAYFSRLMQEDSTEKCILNFSLTNYLENFDDRRIC